MTARLKLPDGTRQKLARFQQRVWKIKLIEGICAAIFGLIATYLLVFVLDRFIETPGWLRLALLCVGSLGLGVFFPLKCHRWLWKTRKLEQLARLLKHQMPRLSDRMLGIIELANSDVEQDRSAALCAAALRQVDEDIKDTSFDDAVPNPRHKAWTWATAIPAIMALLLLFVIPAAGFSTLKRWMFPLKDTPRYTFAQLSPMKNELVVPFGESFDVVANLSDDTDWSPKSAKAQLGNQPQMKANLTESAYAFALPPQQQAGVLSISAGDAKKKIQVQPKRRPELTEITATVKLPEYLQYTDRLTKDVRAGTLTVLKGSKTQLLASASRELERASLNGQAARVLSQQFETQPVTLEASETLLLDWSDKHSLGPKKPFELKIETHDDLPPNVLCSQLARQQVVLVDEVLTFEVQADDDFGVQEIGIEWQGLRDALTNPTPDHGEAIIATGTPEAANLTTKATFSPTREEIGPQTLQVRLYAKDYLPGRERVYSPPYTLFVLSQQDHANWLAERMKLWSRKAQGVYEREIQLFEGNKALRELPANELEQKSNRQRIETQAAAESLNGRHLASVAMTGKQLIKEAARNDQFNITTMEGLAEMVATLDDLAKNRMPSVADLLKKAASSKPKSDGKSGKPSKDSDSPSAPKVGNNRDSEASSGSDDTKKQDDDSQSNPPTPSIVDVESSMYQGDKSEDEKKNGEQKSPPGGSPKFGLPSTTVYGDTPKGPKDEQPQPQPEMQEALDDAIQAQESLLDEFTKVAEELQRILDNLEGSTFVKRLKAASRRQTEVARELNNSLAEKFGRKKAQLTGRQLDTTTAIVDREREEGKNLATIKSDLEAYYQRVQQGKFGTVIREMEELEVMARLDNLSELVDVNLHGQSISHAEFWADTFDRWAEQLVGPG